MKKILFSFLLLSVVSFSIVSKENKKAEDTKEVNPYIQTQGTALPITSEKDWSFIGQASDDATFFVSGKDLEISGPLFTTAIRRYDYKLKQMSLCIWSINIQTFEVNELYRADYNLTTGKVIAQGKLTAGPHKIKENTIAENLLKLYIAVIEQVIKEEEAAEDLKRSI
jgi:hypothetical protein